MKKRHLLFIFVFFTLSIFTVSCKKEISDTEKCDRLFDTYEQAVNDYVANPNTETCEAFTEAIEDYMNGCAILSAAQRQNYQEQIDETDCSQL